MVDKRISELPELPSSDVSDGDWIVVTDSSTNTSKKLDFGDYKLTQDAADATAGRLLQVGDFGLGANRGIAESDDWNNIRRAGFYNPAPGAANGPGGTFNWAASYFPSFNDNNGTQLAFKKSTTPAMYLRDKVGGTWFDWYEVYHSGNAVGTIADGALFETGSGPNGRWYKYADGRLEAHHKITLDFLSTKRLSGTWTFPTADFVAEPVLQSTRGPRYNFAPLNENIGSISINPGATSGADYFLFVVSGTTNFTATDTTDVFVSAFGRWK